jgi:hypothetical protein
MTMHRIVLILVVFLTPSLAFGQSGQVTSVYVRTLITNPPHADQPERSLIRDLVRKNLPDNKRLSHQITVADVIQGSTLTLEITAAQRQERVLPTTNRVEVIVVPSYSAKARLTFQSSYSTEFEAVATESSYRRTINSGKFNTPQDLENAVTNVMRLKAATDLVTKVRSWIFTNETELRAK